MTASDRQALAFIQVAFDHLGKAADFVDSETARGELVRTLRALKRLARAVRGTEAKS